MSAMLSNHMLGHKRHGGLARRGHTQQATTMKDVLAAILQAASEPGSTVPLIELGAVLQTAREDLQLLDSCPS